MDYMKQLQKNNKKIAEIMDIFNKRKVEGNFKIQVDNSKYEEKENFQNTGAMVSWLFYQMTESWREHVIDIEKEINADKEIIWKWKFNDKGQKLYNKRAKELTLK